MINYFSRSTRIWNTVILISMAAPIVHVSNMWILKLLVVVTYIIMSGFILSLLLVNGRSPTQRWLRSIQLVLPHSIINLVLIGLTVNTIGLAVGVDKPLNVTYLTMILYAETLLLLVFARVKNITIPWPSHSFLSFRFATHRNVYLTAAIGLLALVCSILGAIQLNNGGPGFLMVFSYLLDAVIILLIVARRAELPHISNIILLVLVSASIIASGWLRGSGISSIDVAYEYDISLTTQSLGYWAPSNFPGHSYNASLSVSLLPTVVSELTSISQLTIFKYLLPALSIATPVLVYWLASIWYNKRAANLAAILYIAQIAFINWYTIPIRQVVALFFFGYVLILLSLRQRAAAVVAAASVVLAHYSTAYILSAFLVIAYIIQLAYRNRSSKVLNGLQHKILHLPGYFVLTVMLITFFWIAQSTNTDRGIIQTVDKLSSNISKMFSSDAYRSGITPVSQLGIVGSSSNDQEVLDKYTSEVSKKLNNNSMAVTLTAAGNDVEAYRIEPHVANYIVFATLAVRVVGKLIILAGVLFVIIMVLRGNRIAKAAVPAVMAAAIVPTLIVVLPFASINYDLARTFQQMLFILAIPVAVVCIIFETKLLRDKGGFTAAVFIAMLFLSNSSALSYVVGGTNVSMIFATHNTIDGQFLFSQTDLSVAHFIDSKINTKTDVLHADMLGAHKLSSVRVSGLNGDKIRQPIVAALLRPGDYVYLYKANLMHVGMAALDARIVNYHLEMPQASFTDSIYSNPDSRIMQVQGK